jgi:hypothetical protein
MLIVGMLVSTVALAQGTSVITGTVTDAATGKPVSDVVLTAKSPALQGEEVVVTDSAGLFRLAQLPAGEYLLKLEKESYKPFSRGEITVRLDRTVRVNIQLQPESVQSDVIVVAGRPPTVDVGSTTQGINVGKEFINNIAFIRPTTSGVRSFESLAAVAPQVSADTYGYGFSGAQSAENLYILDGVSVNSAGYGTNSGTMPVDFIQEANIITGAYQAEYGRSGGGVINAVTKSGSNEFHGSVFANYTPGLLSPNSPDIPVAGRAAVLSTKLWNIVDFGADVGGPIIKDRLWFYAGISPSWNRTARNQYLNNVNTDEKIEGSDRRVFDDRRNLSFIAKLTLLIDSDNTLSVSANGAYSDRHVPTFSTGNPASAYVTKTVGFNLPDATTSVSAKYAGSFVDKHLLVDASLGWFRQTDTGGTGTPDDGSSIGSTTGAASIPGLQLNNPNLRITDYQVYPDSVVTACNGASGTENNCPLTGSGRYTIGGYGFMKQVVNDRITARASLTYLLTAAGHHIFKAGADFDHTVYDITKTESGLVFGRQAFSASTGGTVVDYRNYAYLTAPDQITTQSIIHIAPSTNQLGLYIQDSWSIMDLVTLNVGLRYDNQLLYAGNGDVGLALKNQLSPRVGLIYDFTNQGRSKLYVNYGRYYESIPLDLADRALSGEFQAGRTRRATCNSGFPNLDPNAQQTGACALPSSWVYNGSSTNPSRYASQTGGGTTSIDPAIEGSSKDEFVVGGEYEVLTDLRLGVTYTKSWANKIIEDMSNDEASTYFLGNPGYGIANTATTGFPKAVRDYDAVTVSATKAFTDGWMAQVSYTWSYLRGNWNGFYSVEYAQLDPGITADFDLKSLLANHTGPLSGDRTHFIKAYGSKEFVIADKVSLLLGVTYEGSSGTPVNYTGTHILYGDGAAFILPRGSAGRTPWTHTINLKVGAGYRFDKDLGIQFAVDGLNMFNFAGVTTVDQAYTVTSVAALPYTGNAPDPICAAGAPATCTPVNLLNNGDGTTSPMTVADINPNFKKPTAYQLPMQWRFSVKFTF